MDDAKQPRLVVLAGINGAGKTTASQVVLTKVLKIPIFVNADIIARGLNSLNPEGESIAAGRLMLVRLDELAAERADFAFETTLSGRAYVNYLERLRAVGYFVYLHYYWLASPDVAIGRVAGRVKAGGHFVPDATIRLRYQRSVRNFFELYRPLADEWEVYDNTHGRKLVAMGSLEQDELIDDPTAWADFQRSASDD